jgi:hypothetical protein
MSLPTPTREDELVMRGIRAFYDFLVAVPWLWLLLLTIFVAYTAVQTGSWPSYGQPDPKTIPLLYWPTFLLFLATLASAPLWVMLTVFALRPAFPIHIKRRDLIIYAIGMTTAVVIILTDSAGLITWLID